MPPERGHHRTAGSCNKRPQEVVAYTAQLLTCREIRGPHYVEQCLKNVVFVEEGQFESLSKLTGDSGLTTRRQARDYDEAMMSDGCSPSELCHDQSHRPPNTGSKQS
jgi:hypothetical protein